MSILKDKDKDKNKDYLIKEEIFSTKEVSEEKGKKPWNFIMGSITSLSFFIMFYYLSNNIAIYFANHRPSNTSDLVKSISISINTLVIGLFYLATFSFAFIGIGLFIIFIRSFFLKKS